MSLDELIDAVPEFVRRVGLGLLGLIERMVPSADALEPYAAVIGWAMFALTGVVVVLCMVGLLTRR